MTKNIILDIGGVLAEEVNGRALTYLTTAEQKRASDLIYFKSPDFIEVLLGNESSANYSAQMVKKYPSLKKRLSFFLTIKTYQPHIRSSKKLWTYYIDYTIPTKSIFCQT